MTFAPGDQVYKLNEPDKVGVIVGPPRVLGTIEFYPVTFEPPQVEQVVATNLARFRGQQDVDSLLHQGIFAGHEAFSRLMTFIKLSSPLSDTLYAFLASRTNLYPYQYKPLLKFLESSNHRLLIADEVGLGKTIESGLILIEHRARASLDRVLIVCTASLRAKWKDELARRFDEHFRIVDRKGFREILDDVSTRGTTSAFRAIASYGTIRGKDVLARLEVESPPLDLLIVDEAHHVRNPTLATTAVAALGEAADAVLLLTATPVHLGNENLFGLLRLLDPEQFDRFDAFQKRMEANAYVVKAGRQLLSKDERAGVVNTLRLVENTNERGRFLANPLYREVLADLASADLRNPDVVIDLQGKISELNFLSRVLSRSRKAEVQPNRPQRAPQVVRFPFTPLEMEIYQNATMFARDAWSKSGAGSVESFSAIMRQRQVASCVPAALEHFRRKVNTSVAPDDLAELSDVDSDESLEITNSALEAVDRFANYYSRIADLERHDSKFQRLVELIRRLDGQENDRKKIVFSYFKATLHYLHRRLSALGYRTLVLTGDVPSRPDDPERDERAQLLEKFRTDPDVQILLSSEVGSEGLDFQFCSVLVNYDLPWNPMVVEQRIGRLDRIGQRSPRITIVTLSVEDTIEDRILQRLYERIGIFRDSIGDLEAILGEVVTKLQSDLLTSSLSAEEQVKLIDQQALILAQEQAATRKLEQRSGDLIGHDEFFVHQLDRTQRLRLYVTPRELEVFLRQYLSQHYPDADISYNWDVHEGMLTTPDSLILSVRRHTSDSDPLLRLFLQRTLRGQCRFTLDSEHATRDPALEFITGHHPLIQSAIGYYKGVRSELHPVSVGQVPSNSVTPGWYLYSVELVQASGIRPRAYLEPTFVSIASGTVLTADASRELLGRFVEEGLDVPRANVAVSGEAVIEARRIALDEVGERIRRRREELGRTNERLADARIASLTASYEARRRQKGAMLELARARNREARYLRMLEGTLRNMKSEYEARLEKINQTRVFNLSFSTIAAGLVLVNEPD